MLQLGCGSGAEAIALARQGARVIAVDPSLHRIETARANVEPAEVKVELHQSDLAELPFVRADTIDVALSVYALANVDDLDRVFRQVHRVLHPECPSCSRCPTPPTPCSTPTGRPAHRDPLLLRPLAAAVGHRARPGQRPPRTIGDLFTSLARTNFRVDTILEPEPGGNRSAFWHEAMRWAPATLVIRARKEGI